MPGRGARGGGNTPVKPSQYREPAGIDGQTDERTDPLPFTLAGVTQWVPSPCAGCIPVPGGGLWGWREPPLPPAPVAATSPGRGELARVPPPRCQPAEPGPRQTGAAGTVLPCRAGFDGAGVLGRATRGSGHPPGEAHQPGRCTQTVYFVINNVQTRTRPRCKPAPLPPGPGLTASC